MRRIGLAVESMKKHTTSEGYEIFEGLELSGYILHGYNLGPSLTDAKKIVEMEKPDTLLLQDKREWDVGEGCFREPEARFTNTEALKDRSDIFKGTILKDSHQRPQYHRESADEIGCHFWVIYYHPRIVSHLAPYTRPEHLIRTYHSINLEHLPSISFKKDDRQYCLLSGAMGHAYPLRTLLSKHLRAISDLRSKSIVHYLPHPGYHRNGCQTPEFLKTLSKYKVAICTASIYGYALRKIIEATACGCVVLTDLPSDEVLPYIDGNLARIDPSTPPREIGRIIKGLADSYDPEKQRMYSELAKGWYSHLEVGKRLADDIEALRLVYPKGVGSDKKKASQEKESHSQASQETKKDNSQEAARGPSL